MTHLDEWDKGLLEGVLDEIKRMKKNGENFRRVVPISLGGLVPASDLGFLMALKESLKEFKLKGRVRLCVEVQGDFSEE